MIEQLLKHLGQGFTWLVIVAPWEQAIRIRAGKHVRLLGAGAYLRIPFIDRVYRQTVRRRISTIRPQTLTTIDGHTISLASCLGYSIADLRKLFNTLDHAEGTLEAEVASLISAFVQDRTLEQCVPYELQRYVQVNLKLEKYGVADVEFFLTCFATVKTYRFITGDLPTWNQHGFLDTTQHDQPR